MRTVPRHLFLPGVSVEMAYAGDAVVTHRDAEGVAISSASEPGIVAMMLEQIDVRPGHRVLEIGAGTGYNAALLAHLAGSAGSVTTVDIDAAVTESARRGLAAAGYETVRVVCGDGENGYPPDAPYDRVIVTAGAWDLPPAWREQLAPGGRIVVPLRMRGLTRSVALERDGRCWRSRSIEECGFVPIRGAGHHPERDIALDADGKAVLRVDDGLPADSNALRRAVGQPPAQSWTGATVTDRDLGDLDYWLATLGGLCRLITRSADHGLAAPLYRWGGMALVDQETFAYLTLRPAGGTDDRAVSELALVSGLS